MCKKNKQHDCSIQIHKIDDFTKHLFATSAYSSNNEYDWPIWFYRTTVAVQDYFASELMNDKYKFKRRNYKDKQTQKYKSKTYLQMITKTQHRYYKFPYKLHVFNFSFS